MIGHAGPQGGRPTAPAERRRHTRVPVYGRAQITSGRRTISADLVNVSRGGVQCIVLDAKAVPEFDSRLDPPILLEGEVSGSHIRLDVAGRITWRKDLGPSTELGVVFGDLDNRQAELVQGFLVTAGDGPGS